MAEENGAPSADPSMEEILASIRKIISDDAPPAVAQPEAVPEPVPVEPVAADDVLELTQMVQEDGSVTDLAAPEPMPESMPEPASVSRPVAVPPLAEASPLVSEPAMQTAASALSSLASTVEIDRLSSMPQSNTYIGNGSRTLEDMVLELMRPMLKDWLDKNLPATVDRLVQKEIERISKRA